MGQAKLRGSKELRIAESQLRKKLEDAEKARKLQEEKKRKEKEEEEYRASLNEKQLQRYEIQQQTQKNRLLRSKLLIAGIAAMALGQKATSVDPERL